MYWKKLYQKKEKRLFILTLTLIFSIGVLQYPIAKGLKTLYDKIRQNNRSISNWRGRY
jgi:hypothetical protein